MLFNFRSPLQHSNLAQTTRRKLIKDQYKELKKNGSINLSFGSKVILIPLQGEGFNARRQETIQLIKIKSKDFHILQFCKMNLIYNMYKWIWMKYKI